MTEDKKQRGRKKRKRLVRSSVSNSNLVKMGLTDKEGNIIVTKEEAVKDVKSSNIPVKKTDQLIKWIDKLTDAAEVKTDNTVRIDLKTGLIAGGILLAAGVGVAIAIKAAKD